MTTEESQLESVNKLQISLDKIDKWTTDWKIKLNQYKSLDGLIFSVTTVVKPRRLNVLILVFIQNFVDQGRRQGRYKEKRLSIFIPSYVACSTG